MKRLPRLFGLYVGIGVLLGAALVLLLVLGPRWLATPVQDAPIQTPTAPADARKIRARLFYVNEQGTGLTSVEQEIVYGEGTVEQAKRIVEAQLAPVQAPLVSAIPPDTKLRTVFFTKTADLYVDLTAEVQRNHPGGATNEILTVYALVSALTSNLPAISSVQILIEGREVDTLAGHLDLRRPIEPDARWVTD
jgi:spore germination protein GerM